MKENGGRGGIVKGDITVDGDLLSCSIATEHGQRLRNHANERNKKNKKRYHHTTQVIQVIQVIQTSFHCPPGPTRIITLNLNEIA